MRQDAHNCHIIGSQVISVKKLYHNSQNLAASGKEMFTEHWLFTIYQPL